MDADLLSHLIPLIVLLGISAYFSGSEAAFFSLSSLERDVLSRKPGSRLRAVMKQIQGTPDRILITLLTGNMFVNVFASSLGEAIGVRVFPVGAGAYSVVAMTVLLLVTGEMLPKNLGVRHPAAFVQFSSGPLYYLVKVLAPMRWFLNLFNRAVERLFPLESGENLDGRHNLIRSAVQIGFKEGILDQSEQKLVESFCDFRDRSVDEIMIPRMQITGVELSTSISQLLARPDLPKMAAQDSVIPVFEGDLDHVVGYVPILDLLPYKYGLADGDRLQEAMRPELSVPSSKDCADLLVEMRASNTELAIVVDEFGGTAGMVTVKKLVEELLGYFYARDLDSLLEVSTGGYRVPGSLRIDELERLVGRQIETDSHTVAGLILERLEDLPQAGAAVTLGEPGQPGELRLTVLRASRNRVLEVEITKAQV